MNLRRSLKYSLLTLGVLSGVVLTLGATTDSAHAMGPEQDGSHQVTWAPQVFSDDKVSYSFSNTGGQKPFQWSSHSKSTFYRAKSGIAVTFKNLGHNPNYSSTTKAGKKHQVNVKVTMSNFSKNVKFVGTEPYGGFNIEMATHQGYNTYLDRSMHLKLQFYDSVTGKQVKWDNDYIGLAYSDLEPKVLYLDGKEGTSFNQYVTSLTDTTYWKPLGNIDGAYSWINRSNASYKGVFGMANNWKFPRNMKESSGLGYNYKTHKTVKETKKNADDLIHYIWDDALNRDLRPSLHYSGAAAVYKATGTKTINLKVNGSANGVDQFVFSGLKVYPKKPTNSTIGKSITYNGKTTKSNTLLNQNDTMAYNLVAKLNMAKKGAYISDAIPHRFTVTSVSGVSGFTHNSVADINKTHQFKASINTTKYQTATNKVVTFHLAGNVGEWMSKHPNTSLKWPFYNHAIWHKTSTDTPGTPSNKVKTTFGKDKVNPTKHKVVFNFYDFDHHTSLIRVVAAQQVTVA